MRQSLRSNGQTTSSDDKDGPSRSATGAARSPSALARLQASLAAQAVSLRIACIVLCFSALLLFGLSLYKDFGVSYDEVWHINLGHKSVQHAVELLTGNIGEAAYMDTPHPRSIGPIFQMVLHGLRWALGLEDSRSIILMRHLATHLFFLVGVWFFYLLCQERFQSTLLSLLGCALLVLHPRIYAHSFYNTVDIPFLAAFIISVYALLKYLESFTHARAVCLAASCSVLMSIRVVGGFVALLALGFLLMEGRLRLHAQLPVRRLATTGLLFIGLCAALTFLFWPYLWGNPAGQLGAAVQRGIDVKWPLNVFYLGRPIKGMEVPWHYNFVWMGITTPFLCLLLFFCGLGAIGRQVVARSAISRRHRTYDSVILLWLTVPLIAPILLGATLYNDWRHHYFVYPAVVIIALHGVRFLFESLPGSLPVTLQKALRVALSVVIGLGLLQIAHSMARLHPYQGLYFNRLAGVDIEAAHRLFILDYWGLSHREALAWLVRNIPDDPIILYDGNPRTKLNALVLPRDHRMRLRYSRRPENAEYFIAGNGFPIRRRPRFPEEVFAVNVDGAKAAVVYRRPRFREP